MPQKHQPGESIFRSVLPEEIDWKPFPAFPASARLAVLVGEPSNPGPYLIRVKLPHGVKLMPHKHPEDRIDTVMSGVFYIGLGEQFDGDKVKAYPPGSIVVLPGNTPHFHWAKSGEYVTQVSAIGPLGLDYLDPVDDPREQHAVRADRLRKPSTRMPQSPLRLALQPSRPMSRSSEIAPGPKVRIASAIAAQYKWKFAQPSG